MSEAARAFLFRIDALLRKWGPLVLVVFAVAYYGQYYRSGLNLGGEGGTAAVNAMRLNEGWLPIKDTTLNYNVMWFYPVAWLFTLTGPDYLALRIYFFALCLVTGVLGFLIVRRVTGSGWYALGVGLLILAIPGMMFRNYMGLITLLNAWAMLHAFVWPPARSAMRWVWFAVAGIVFGLTWLLRVEIGFFYAVIYLGLIALYPFGVAGEFRRRIVVAAGGGVLCLGMAVAAHVPFFLDAQKRGFGREFAGDYLVKWSYLKYEVTRTLLHSTPKPVATEPAPTPRTSQVGPSGYLPVRFKKTPKNWVEIEMQKRRAQLEEQRKGRSREKLGDVLHQATFGAAAYILLLYLPIPISALIIAVAGVVLLVAIIRRDAPLKEAALTCLVTVGCALTLFSQYFFFRPDTPHLSEFMIGFLVALACASFYAARAAARCGGAAGRAATIAFIIGCAATEALYFFHAYPKESSGSIAAARKRSYEVSMDNGVRVLVKRGEQPRLQSLHDTIVRHAAPGEWVVAFPYSPTINFMTNRPSYLKDLYIDNATASAQTLPTMIAQIEQFRPAVIVIDQRDINGTEISRFRNWAAPAYDYIRRHYVRVGKDGEFDENEVYVRRDKATAGA